MGITTLQCKDVCNKNAFQSKAHFPHADRMSNTYNLFDLKMTLVSGSQVGIFNT